MSRTKLDKPADILKEVPDALAASLGSCHLLSPREINITDLPAEEAVVIDHHEYSGGKGCRFIRVEGFNNTPPNRRLRTFGIEP